MGKLSSLLRRGTPLKGAVVVITGGGSGIGRLMALGAAERGADVAIWDLDAEAAQRVATEITDRGRRGLAVEVNVADQDMIAAAAERTRSELGLPDVVVNNAGIVTGAYLTDATDRDIRRTFEVNALAPYWVTRAFLAPMIERNSGHIVTIASAAGLIGVSKQVDYAGSKFAAVGFTDSLRAELRERGTKLRTTGVCPYYIDTGMFDGVATRFPLILPILDENVVARKILDAIESGRRLLVMPPVTRLLWLARLVGTDVLDTAADILGINKTMEKFTGHGRTEPREVPAPGPVAAERR